MLSLVVSAVGWTATTLSVGTSVPQLWRTCVQGQIAGLPAARFWLGTCMSMCWLTYGLVGGGPQQVVCNLVVGAMSVALLVTLLRHCAEARRAAPVAAVAALGWCALVVAAAHTWGMSAVGALGAVVGTAAGLPQLLHLLRSDGAPAGGVSRGSLWCALACAGAWAAYGTLSADPAVTLPSLVSMAVNGWLLRLVPAGRAGGDQPYVLLPDDTDPRGRVLVAA